MRELQFSGVLDCYAGDLTGVGPYIDGRDVIQEVEEMWPGAWKKDIVLKVFLGTQPNPNFGYQVEGNMFACHGFGGTDVTPSDPPEIKVGDVDLMRDLFDHDDEVVLLIFEGP